MPRLKSRLYADQTMQCERLNCRFEVVGGSRLPSGIEAGPLGLYSHKSKTAPVPPFTYARDTMSR